MSQTFADEKPVGRDAQRGMVMKAAPVATLEVVQAELLFEFLIVALDAPANLDGGDQRLAGDVRRQRGEKVFGRLGLLFGPLDQ
jgi:hypothetical protein